MPHYVVQHMVTLVFIFTAVDGSFSSVDASLLPFLLSQVDAGDDLAAAAAATTSGEMLSGCTWC